MIKFCRFFAKYKTNFQLRKSMEPLKPIPKHEVLPFIEPTSSEKELFSLFTTFVNEEALQTTLRVAGGWVRDKVKENLMDEYTFFMKFYNNLMSLFTIFCEVIGERLQRYRYYA